MKMKKKYSNHLVRCDETEKRSSISDETVIKAATAEAKKRARKKSSSLPFYVPVPQGTIHLAFRKSPQSRQGHTSKPDDSGKKAGVYVKTKKKTNGNKVILIPVKTQTRETKFNR